MIRRAEHSAQNRFFLFSRKTAQDKNLSFQARGLLTYVLSKPPKWEAKDRDIMKQGDIKKHAYASILNELKEAGYARRIEEPRKGGKFQYSLEISEEPCFTPESPVPENQVAAEPIAVDPPTVDQVAAIDSTCARAANTLSTDKRELREKGKPRPPGYVKPKKIPCPADMLERHAEIAEMFPEHNGSLEKIMFSWREFRLGQTHQKLRTEDEWYHDCASWIARQKPDQNGNGANGKQQSTFETASQRDLRLIRESNAARAISRQAALDNHSVAPRAITPGSGTGNGNGDS